MKKLSISVIFIFLIGNMSLSAQQSEIYTNTSVEYNRALTLFKNKQYQSAQILFDKIKQEGNTDMEADCAYYSANCALQMNQSNADEKIEAFIKNYPTSTKQNLAHIDAATYYFEQGNYTKSLEMFDQVDEGSLTSDELDRYNFYKGYSFFNSGKKKEARQYFNKVENSAEYGSQAKYYIGYLAYEGDNYEEANQYFDAVSGEEKYKEKLSYFQADMSFKAGKFEKAIQLGQAAMAKSSPAEKSELNKIIGESYFNLKQYDKAIPYLKEYKGKKGKWNNTDYYQLGYAYYKQNDFENAIAQFNKIIGGNDGVAQNAYYHLGESYLKTDKKQQALNAFKNASEMTFDLKIQEDAYLNYARLSYDIGNSYQSVPEVLNGFMTKYPNNPNKPEIENLLVNSYITSKNYKEALVLLEKNKALGAKGAYQKVAFYRGLELFTDGDYNAALAIFKKSIAEQKEAIFSARATFWKAETEYVLDDFQNALLTFKQFVAYPEAKETPEFKTVNYNIAYSHFKLKEYEPAATYFAKYTETSKEDKTRLVDAYLRLADCRFVTSKYTSAIEAYDKAIAFKGVDVDYAAFQKAISYGFAGKNDKKIAEFNSFIKNYPDSQYRDDAMFELANTYTTINETTSAIKTYDQLISEYRKSSYTAKAILRQGLIYYNGDKDDLALTKFKKVAAEFPKTEEALEAVKTARLIYVDSGRVEEYATWVKTLDYVEVSDAELDNDSWEAAEKQYSMGNTQQAIESLSSYVKNFPNGLHSLKANFYLAESLYKTGATERAIANYENVIAKSRNEFTEQSLSRLCEIFVKKGDYTKAIPVLLRLEAEADYPQNKTYAQANLMKGYYDTKDYAKSVVYADKVLANPKTDNKIKSDAQIIIARSAIQVGDEAKAKEAYAKLLKIAKGELAAEALYYDAYFKHKEGKFEVSNTVVQKLAKEYSGYKYFGAKGLVVMAKNFYGLKDSFQATYILESVITNFTQFDDVLTEAKTELAKIRAEEAKTNSSVGK
ncbi:tetratricopeptide repeat protein [Flavobacterium sp. GCM10027622]|uniref:tetratricopeptide repeat protein n=1 Tax=unclassified Flavobacterium TaxID=196869 RepID=UPI003620D234